MKLIENYKPVNPQVINSRLNDLQMRLDKDRDALLQKLDVVDNRIDSLGTDVNIKLGNLEKTLASNCQILTLYCRIKCKL